MFDHCDLFSFCFYALNPWKNPTSPFVQHPVFLSLLYASWCGTTRYWIEKETQKRRLTSVDKSQAVIVVAPLRIPLLCQPVSSSMSQLSQLCRILPPHILCFCIRHAWLVFMKYFFLFLKNTTFIFKGHYQYMSMIIMKLSLP